MAKKRIVDQKTIYGIEVRGHQKDMPGMLVEGECANCGKAFSRYQYPGRPSRFCDDCRNDPEVKRAEVRQRKRRQRAKQAEGNQPD